MTFDTALLILLEKKNLYYPPGPEKKEGKYQGKFTNDEFDIREIIDAQTHHRNRKYTMLLLRRAVELGLIYMHQTRHWLPLKEGGLLSL
jgi:hypothetical protein